ncbi:MAG TPA: tyrosine-type recombinase/integrase [Verrucomicrobiae bacterium]|nr:tyrosine-type recombinase/integrase [Verrucomicrobiae bacterium]
MARVARAGDHDQLAAYVRVCAELGLSDRALRDRLHVARAFLAAHPDLDAWLARPLPTRLADLRRIRAWPLLTALACAGAIQLDMDLLLAKDLGGLGVTAARVWASDFRRATAAATRLGWRLNWIRDVIRECLPLVLVWTATAMVELTDADLEAVRVAIETSPAAARWTRRRYTGRLFSLQTLLYELGNPTTPPRRRLTAATLEGRFQAIDAPELRRPMLAYLRARSAALSASSIAGLANDLLVFSEYLGQHHPEVSGLPALERSHIEGFLVWNRHRPWRGRLARAAPVSISVVHRAVLTLRNFLDDITLWGWADRPARRLVFATDVPRLPRPLPRALAPDHDAALMGAVEQLADPFARSALILLRRAGLRLGECLDLELDGVVDFGRTGSWLRVPLGKLGTERMVPLDPPTVAVLDTWAHDRGPQRPQPHPTTGVLTDFLFSERGQRLGPWRLRSGLRTATRAAGLTGAGGAELRVTPHQLRHTYATELANAGMSLQGLMALLGHVTPEMTLRYATLASPTLRAGYDAAIGKVRRALPSLPVARPVVPDRVAWIASEFLKTRVATGYCSRHLAAGPCAYANICETCDTFVPVADSAGAIRAQLVDVRALRDDAIRRGWAFDVERHRRVIDSLETHLARLANRPPAEHHLDTPPMAG